MNLGTMKKHTQGTQNEVIKYLVSLTSEQEIQRCLLTLGLARVMLHMEPKKSFAVTCNTLVAEKIGDSVVTTIYMPYDPRLNIPTYIRVYDYSIEDIFLNKVPKIRILSGGRDINENHFNGVFLMFRDSKGEPSDTEDYESTMYGNWQVYSCPFVYHPDQKQRRWIENTVDAVLGGKIDKNDVYQLSLSRLAADMPAYKKI